MTSASDRRVQIAQEIVNFKERSEITEPQTDRALNRLYGLPLGELVNDEVVAAAIDAFVADEGLCDEGVKRFRDAIGLVPPKTETKHIVEVTVQVEAICPHDIELPAASVRGTVRSLIRNNLGVDLQVGDGDRYTVVGVF